MRKKIVVFDFDNTLIKGDSIIIAAYFASNKFNFIPRVIKIIPYFLLFKLSFISAKSFKEKFLEIFKICSYFNKNHTSGYLNKIKKKLNREALKRLHIHKINNDIIYICSASPYILLKGISSYLNINLISTELEKKDGKFLPQIKGNNCNGYEKVVRLRKALGQIDDFILEVYGDSSGDKELLNIAEIPHFKSFEEFPKPYPNKI